MSGNAGDGRKTEVSEAGLSILVDKDVRLWMSRLEAWKDFISEELVPP